MRWPSRGNERAIARLTTAHVLLVGYVLFALLLGATEAGRLTTEVRAAAALSGAVLVAAYIWMLPRQHDIVDVLVLIGLLLFLLTCVTSSAIRASFDAATTAVAYVAAFYLARGLFADETNRHVVITLMAIIGVVVGVLFLLLWGPIWLRWTAIAGAPPLDLNLPVPLYRHRYLVGTLAAMLLPATVMLAQRRAIWPIGLFGVVATSALTFMSGGRTVWLAGLAAAVVALPAIRGLPGASILRRRSGIAFIGIPAAALVLMAVPVLSRLGATSTIELRLSMWAAALDHWLQSAFVGFGPGSFAAEFATTGYQAEYEIDVPNAHNAIVQTLFEGGLIGTFGLGLVCAAVIVGVIRAGSVRWSSAAAIAFFVVACITGNPTVAPFLVVLAIIWAALASPRSVPAGSTPRRLTRVLTLAAATITGVAVVATLGGAWWFDRAREAVAAGDHRAVLSNLRVASALDPSFPLYHRELGVWFALQGRNDSAANELSLALNLNPGDDEALRTAAVVYARTGDRTEALAIAAQLQATKGARVEDVLMAAYVRAQVADLAGSQEALTAAVQLAPWVTADPSWTLAFPASDINQTLSDAHRAWVGASALSTRTAMARAWLAELAGANPPDGAKPGIRLQTAVIGCRRLAAESLITSLVGSSAVDVDALRGELMFQRAFERSPEDSVQALLAMRDPTMPALEIAPYGRSRPGDHFDLSMYARRTLSSPPVVTLPTGVAGMSAWLRDPLAAAAIGAPMSRLAHCS